MSLYDSCIHTYAHMIYIYIYIYTYIHTHTHIYGEREKEREREREREREKGACQAMHMHTYASKYVQIICHFALRCLVHKRASYCLVLSDQERLVGRIFAWTPMFARQVWNTTDSCTVCGQTFNVFVLVSKHYLFLRTQK